MESQIKKDKFGPEYIIEVYDPRIGLEGFLVIDNTVLGPGKGGIRMTPNVTSEEIFRLARTMTWKNSLADIPFGGAKAGIKWSGGPLESKKEFIQSFAKAIKLLTPKKYIAGPDVGTGEEEMRWFVEATGNWRSATGKPAKLCMRLFGRSGEKCGIPHEFGSTGFGVAQATKAIADLAGLKLENARVAIHGFGNVGTFVYKFLTDMGAKVVALADISGAFFRESGFNPKIVKGLVGERRPLTSYSGAMRLKPEDFWSLPVDILIPASVTDVINNSNKNKIRAKIIVEAGNIPMSEGIEEELFKKGILIVPDFVANAGGVISSYAEYRGYNPKRMFDVVKRKITKTAQLVLKKSIKKGRNPRVVATEAAMAKIEKSYTRKIKGRY